MTKIIIIEGQDNTGKDTLIRGLESLENTTTKQYHFTSPEKYLPDVEDKKVAQYTQFSDIFKNVREDVKSKQYDLIILNRSHIGEWVYGPIYRGTNSEWIFDEFEIEYEDIIRQSTLFLLLAPPELSINYDDGLSHSTKVTDKKREQRLFIEAFSKSSIKNKMIVGVHKQGTSEFRDKKDILKDVTNFINYE